MRLELAQLVTAWPLGVSLAAAMAAQGIHAGRRRSALNEALHELRRPLQALALAAPAVPSRHSAAIEGTVRLAAAALERLEREVNGDSRVAARAPVSVRPLLGAGVGRWRHRAILAGGSLEQRCLAGDAVVEGDPWALAQALDNLIVNAIEHGGPEIVVEARVEAARLRLAVLDSGCVSAVEPGRRDKAGMLARLRGARRRGHGLAVVRRVAAAHGGEFRLHASALGTEALLELPLAGGAPR